MSGWMWFVLILILLLCGARIRINWPEESKKDSLPIFQYYKHIETGEIISELPADIPYYSTGFWQLHVRIDTKNLTLLAGNGAEWSIDRFEPPNTLVFTFSYDSVDDYAQDDDDL